MPKPTIISTGREPDDNFWRLSGLEQGKLKHTPFLVLHAKEDGLGDPVCEIEIVDSYKKLYYLFLPEDTQIMAQWPGQWHSDFFHFTMGEALKHWPIP